MDKINLKNIRKNLKIKSAFFIYATIFLILGLILSVVTVHIVDTFVSTVSVFYITSNDDIDRINKDRDEDVYIAVEMLDEDFEEDSSAAILFYARNSFVALLLVLYFIIGVVIAAHLFFRRKLSEPITLLEKAAQKIMDKDLDFTIEYSANDEMGELCKVFETMRYHLMQNNKEMWNMIEEQKRVQHVLAHDIRTPLTVTKGYVGILREYLPEGKLSEEKILETVECINRNVLRLENFVNIMSDMQKLDDMSVKSEKTNIYTMFEGLKEISQGIIKDKTLIFNCHTDCDTAFTDKSIIEQIITNLISNAVRYAEKEIKLDCGYFGEHFTITVSDDGKGFSPEALDHAFDSYYTEENKSQGIHFGLGLTICKILCDKMGGTIEYCNNGGAQITVRI